jgi:hypothetical protein
MKPQRLSVTSALLHISHGGVHTSTEQEWDDYVKKTITLETRKPAPGALRISHEIARN